LIFSIYNLTNRFCQFLEFFSGKIQLENKRNINSNIRSIKNNKKTFSQIILDHVSAYNITCIPLISHVPLNSLESLFLCRQKNLTNRCLTIYQRIVHLLDPILIHRYRQGCFLRFFQFFRTLKEVDVHSSEKIVALRVHGLASTHDDVLYRPLKVFEYVRRDAGGL